MGESGDESGRGVCDAQVGHVGRGVRDAVACGGVCDDGGGEEAVQDGDPEGEELPVGVDGLAGGDGEGGEEHGDRGEEAAEDDGGQEGFGGGHLGEAVVGCGVLLGWDC